MENTELMMWIGGFFLAFTIFLFGFMVHRFITHRNIKSAQEKANKIISDSQIAADEITRKGEIKAKDLLLESRQNFESETKERRSELILSEKRLLQRENNLDKKADIFDKKEKELDDLWNNIKQKEERIVQKEEKLTELLDREKSQLEKISHMSKEEAKKALLRKMIEDARRDAAKEYQSIVQEINEKGNKEAKRIISMAIERTCVDHAMETTCSVINLPSDELKGRIIGREGRNVRAFETATGVDVIIDDTPGAVTLSGFDKIRREVARISLEKLIEDGRIHPGRIEEVVSDVKQEMETLIKETGEEALYRLDIHNVHPEIIKLIGRLRYRTSYGQNVLAHSEEVAYLMSIMASELGLDTKLAKRIGLLHDIGKALSHEVEGGHAIIGMDIAKKYGESDEVIKALGSHHNDMKPDSVMAVLVQACDAISASRPGARREEFENYIKRLENLENIANSFEGVDRSYALQAGRELRVIVQPQKVDDAQILMLARDITKKIEKEMQFAGQIKTIVIRETRSVEFAK